LADSPILPGAAAQVKFSGLRCSDDVEGAAARTSGYPGLMLPWEGQGEPSGAGICLSGGGLRAASFALGAVQALQDDRRLLFGEECADHLAVVSGGSYLGAALILNAKQLSSGAGGPPAPLAAGSPEASHVVSHGSYLKNWGTAVKMFTGGVVNLLAFVALFVWAAVMLSAAVAAAGAVGIDEAADPAVQLILAVVFVAGARMALRGLYLAGGPWRTILPLAGGLCVIVTAPSTLAAIRQVAPLSEPSWWSQDWRWAAALAVVIIVVGLPFALARVWPHGWGTRLAEWLAARVPAVAGAVLFCLLATELAPRLEAGSAADATPEEVVVGFAILAGALVGAMVMQIIARTSLHRMYRDSLASCFSVRRDGAGITPIAPTAQKLSELAPPPGKQAGSFPRLLVCATANVVWNPKHPDRSPLFRLPSRSNRRFASFVYSHDRCGLPRVKDASYATGDLEKLTTRSGILGGREPIVSLMSAVASTGAAVSPAMGRRTSEVARPALALANLRLGRWVPNPLSARIRGDVQRPDADARLRRRGGFGGSYDEFIPELFGLHQSDAAWVYISDGGHYDNLGLIALLQARCKDVWCVDAEADPTGAAGQLRKVLGYAKDELGIEIDIELAGLPGPEPGVLSVGHAVGTIKYPGPTAGRLVVIKLGLVQGDDAGPLFAYRDVDRGFAHHGTFVPPWRVMWYGPARFEKYRAVGYANALAASQAVGD
jgi:hypothetical protein